MEGNNVQENLHIIGMGHYYPDTIIDNSYLIDTLKVKTNEKFLIDNIGIKERRTLLKLDYLESTRNKNSAQAFLRDKEGNLINAHESIYDMAQKAMHVAMKRAGFEVEDIKFWIGNTCSPEQTTPSFAQRVAGLMGSKESATDWFTACPSFAYHIHELMDKKVDRLKSAYGLLYSVSGVSFVNYTNPVDEEGNEQYSTGDPAIWSDGSRSLYCNSPKTSPAFFGSKNSNYRLNLCQRPHHLAGRAG